jgi:hypothetical protein
MYFAGLTRIKNKQNIQGKGPVCSGGMEEPVVRTTRVLRIVKTILGKLGLV